MEAGEEDDLRTQRERLLHVSELGTGVAEAAAALAPEDGDGAVSLAARAERALAPIERLAPELGVAAGELRDVALRLREVGSDLHGFLASLDADPALVEDVESRLERISDLKRRFGCASYDDLLARAAAARSELEATAGGHDPVEAAAQEVAAAEAHMAALSEALRAERRSKPSRSRRRSRPSCRGSEWGRASFSQSSASATQARRAPTRWCSSSAPTPGSRSVPSAETASGGELSRIALALAAVAGGETLVFDEIDAGIGGVTAHAVASTLQRLAERAQVLTITHLPQIASVADRHFRVEKLPGDPTHTRIEELDDLVRREELERMLGGEEFIAALKER